MARIAIDCDGVLADFSKAFTAEVNRIWPGRLKPDFMPTDWDWSNSGLDKREISKVWRRIKGLDNWWLGLDALPGIGDLAYFLIDNRDHDIWVTTSRAASAGMTQAKQTEIWLKTCNLEPLYNYVGVMTVPDSDKKADFYTSVEIAYSLDDRWQTVQQCNLIDTMHHQAFLLNQPWNVDAPIWKGQRVDSVGEFFSKITGKAVGSTNESDSEAVWGARSARASRVDRAAR